MKKELSIAAIKDGTVIDHVPPSATFKVAQILSLTNNEHIVVVATNLLSKKLEKKGIIKVENKILTHEEVDKIALIAPNATLCVIKNYDVIKKERIKLPKEVYKVVKCSNPNCITNNETVKTKFYVLRESPLKVRCHYCERDMSSKSIVLL